jgi:hypothetical protein
MPRITNDEGTRSAIWTFGTTEGTFPDRGTGYNFTTDGIWMDSPVERIEEIRTGWPSLLYTAGGREIVISHEFPVQLYMASRDEIGSGEWNESYLPTDIAQGVSWNRAVSGGADGNSIHMLAITMPIANQGGTPTLHHGQDGALLYYRSQDQGDSWDLYEHLLPQIDSSQFLDIRADAYAIHSRGDKVAFAGFNDFADSYVMISEDNGDSWTKSILVDFPVDLYTGDDEIIDMDGDMVADTLYNTDNSGHVFIGADGTTHAVWGNMRYLDDVLGDDQWSYFPFTDGLAYWNETMDENTWIDVAYTQDLDDSGLLELEDETGSYGKSLTSQPQIAEDDDGNLYISYSGVVESHSSGSQNYQHVHFIKSEDGGDSWSDPVDGTPDEEFWGFECVYPSMSPVVDDYLHVLYQRDFEPGLHIQGDLDPADLNDIMYYRISTDLVVEEVISVEEVPDFSSLEIFPNPATESLSITLKNFPGSVVELIDLAGKTVLSSMVSNEFITMDVSSVKSGLYFVRIHKGDYVHTGKVIIQ